MFDYLVVGAGIAGCVVAERLAYQGKRVLLVDKRCHVGGNAFDYYDNHGILVHRYGPHIFHTHSKNVFDYLSQFTDWHYYQHRVVAYVDGMYVPIPINVDTLNLLYGLHLSTSEVDTFLSSVRENPGKVATAEVEVVSKVGRDLYEKIFRGYTRKQWGADPSKLDPSITKRIPVRANRDSRYFADPYQGLPSHGYTRMFERMLKNPRISVLLKTDFQDIAEDIRFDRLVYTGPIDSFFDFTYGKLSYRSLRFEFETYPSCNLPDGFYQPVGTVNYPNDYEFTRITEFRHLTGQRHNETTIVREFPESDGEPYYPVPGVETEQVYRRYAAKASTLSSVWFVGRLANYRYYNMDEVAEIALNTAEAILSCRRE